MEADHSAAQSLHHPWTRNLLAAIEDYRAKNPWSMQPDVVRVALDFGTLNQAFDVYESYHGSEEPSTLVVLRGSQLVLHDQRRDVERRCFWGSDFFCGWLATQLDAGRFHAPQIVLCRPFTHPPFGDYQELLEEHAELYQQRHRLLRRSGGRGKSPLKRLLGGPQSDVRDALFVLLLDFVRGRREACRDRETDDLLFGEWHCPERRIAWLPRLADHLTEATIEDWRLLERLASHLPLEAGVQHVRLRVLILLARQQALSPEETATALLAIFEGRDDPLSHVPLLGLLGLLEMAVDSGVLPGRLLRQAIRATLAQFQAFTPEGQELLSSARVESRCRRLLERLDNE